MLIKFYKKYLSVDQSKIHANQGRTMELEGPFYNYRADFDSVEVREWGRTWHILWQKLLFKLKQSQPGRIGETKTVYLRSTQVSSVNLGLSVA